VPKTGQILTGSIQDPSDRSLFNQAVPFLPLDKQQKLRERFGDKEKVAMPIQEATAFIDLIDVQQIASFELIETTVHSIYLLTEGGQKINIEDFRVEFENIGKPGRLKARYQLPENEKRFDLGELEIKDGAILLPVTMAFISYAREDQEKVVSISRDLNEHGIITWFDERMLLPGDNWQLRIEQAIEEADYFLLFLSSQTIDRIGYKNRELHLALYQQSLRPADKRFIVPILLDDCKPPHDLQKLNWVKTTDQNWFKKLLKAIAPFHIKQTLY
jgi:TIR domain